MSSQVYLYDLSQGAARELSPGLLGRDLAGVWHSAVVVYGREYSFTRDGVISIIPVSDQEEKELDRPDSLIQRHGMCFYT